MQEVYKNDTKTGKNREERKNTQKQEETQTRQQNQHTKPKDYCITLVALLPCPG
jgi:hypothetical protein